MKMTVIPKTRRNHFIPEAIYTQKINSSYGQHIGFPLMVPGSFFAHNGVRYIAPFNEIFSGKQNNKLAPGV